MLMPKDTSTYWQEAAQAYLARLCHAEWIAQGKPVPTKRNRHNRYCPSAYANDLVALLGKNDEEGFKARKMLEGYASALSV
jgi:hypothetical protein